MKGNIYGIGLAEALGRLTYGKHDKKCKGSGTVQMLSWNPDPRPSVELGGKPYPGAAICLWCSAGVLVVKGTVHKAVSEAGHEGLAGRLRVHRSAK